MGVKKRSTFSFLFFAVVLLGFLVPSPVFSESSSSRTIEDFSSYGIDKFPSSFRTYPFQRGKAMKVYAVKEEGGNRFLKGETHDGDGTSVFKRFDWDLTDWPHLSWRWKAMTLPHEAKTNDCACGIYVIFGGYNGKSIKYVWSTTVNSGNVIEYEPNKLYVVVKESGAKRAGRWQTIDVNVLEDYRKFFKSDPKLKPSGFAILTDSDDTHSTSICEYDDFKLSNSNASERDRTSAKK